MCFPGKKFIELFLLLLFFLCTRIAFQKNILTKSWTKRAVQREEKIFVLNYSTLTHQSREVLIKWRSNFFRYFFDIARKWISKFNWHPCQSVRFYCNFQCLAAHSKLPSSFVLMKHDGLTLFLLLSLSSLFLTYIQFFCIKTLFFLWNQFLLLYIQSLFK